MAVTHSTFTLERRFPASVEKVFQAWADPQARKRWMARGAEHSQDFVVGGLETVKGSDPQGRPLTYQAQYADIVANERILTTSTLHTGAQLSTVSVTSVEFHGEGSDTLIVLTEHGIYLPGQEQPAWREHGTAEQLDTLAAEFTTTAAPEEN
ncbi:SRPBCC family protein [Mycolicibacterium mucogenicum]|uniref:SRPBCC family protein n=1 Tax=Mycolicibacterium mucogenicum TaxID=56689 RepID=UPI00226AA73D|nr:SRPBCC family protein [Mycolicibacterium mucogenicum]MCX8558125.1 SRPBCC family protein [Mycolicibacterium mucogenicum]